MHDPMTVAFEVILPIPVRRWRASRNEPRWAVRRCRSSNGPTRGQPLDPWWQGHGHGHARTAIGIDLNDDNEDLIRDRVGGLFLTVVNHKTGAAA